MRVLVTGAAGFIGFHFSRRLLEQGHEIMGVDNLNAYYDPQLKKDRLKLLSTYDEFTPAITDISDGSALRSYFEDFRPTHVVNLAAQAGVRYSLEKPGDYVHSNLTGFANVLECCRHGGVEHLIYASTSSIYGANEKMPYAESDSVNHQLNLYAASKKANEAMAHAYAHLFGIPATGLRFFTVYGEWGRPDMAFFKFAKAIMNDEPIDIYNQGEMSRDFTYVADIVEGMERLLDKAPVADKSWDAQAPRPDSSGVAPWRIYNIGNGRPEPLLRYLEVLEDCLGKRAVKNFLPMQPGDVKNTCADVHALKQAIGYSPQTRIETGLANFAAWFKDYYGY